MIQTLAYFPSQCALNSSSAMSAFLQGCRVSGIKTVQDSMDSDAAVIWSVLWHGRMAQNQSVYQHYRSQNKPVIIIEVGALHRGITWKVAVNNVTAKGYYGHLNNLDWNRPIKLKVSPTTPKNPKPEIVIALQHKNSLQVADVDLTRWLQDTLTLLRNNTDRPIVVRQHPRSKISFNDMHIDFKVQNPVKLKDTYDSFDMQFDCHAVVNYNSGPGIQAAIAGVRPVVEISSLAYSVNVGYADIEQYYAPDKELYQLWLTQICHTEYTVDELQNALWFERIAPALEEK